MSLETEITEISVFIKEVGDVEIEIPTTSVTASLHSSGAPFTCGIHYD